MSNLQRLENTSIGGIILAAGKSSRFGQPKQLLEYHGQPFIKYIANTALTAGLNPVGLVLGFDAEKIGGIIQDLPVRVIFNPDWEDGQSTSVNVGICALSKFTRAVLFFLCDQPQVTVSVIKAIVGFYEDNNSPIIIPEVNGILSHPVLFDQSTFHDLINAKGDLGGRQIFPKFPPVTLPWQDERLLIDVDTPLDYKKLLSGDIFPPG